MNQTEVFGQARWVTGSDWDFPVLRRTFVLPEGRKIGKAVLRVLGLGFFRCYLNGKELTERAFLPLSTDYEERENYPAGEELSGHRIYVPEYEVTDLLRKEGKNLLSLFFGGGWYCFWTKKDQGHSNMYYDPDVRFGDPKAIYRLELLDDQGRSTELLSSPEDRVKEGGVYDYSFTTHECRDLRLLTDEALCSADYDDSAWDRAIEAKPLRTEYLFTDCPEDRVAERLSLTKNRRGSYDCGKNISGYPVLKLRGKAGEKVRVLFSELLSGDGTLDLFRNHDQRFEVICDGTERLVMPEFTWFGFRYFTVEGPAEPEYVAVIHTDAAVTSDFDSDSKVLNYLYRTYLNTELCNMHAGIPSDCPHIERRGYTGDGQLTAHAVMTLLDARAFYRKWIDDIGDCQDVLSGHIQYTAPYVRSGGGPGAWGAAIVEVPYRYYRHYGDPEPMFRLYPRMKKYFEYMEAHSENLLVTSDKEGEWCLGDWCAPYQVTLPAAFVNNYYYVKSLRQASEIAEMLGEEEDIRLFEKRIEERQKATKAAYFNTWDSNFIGNFQAANAFAVDMGIGTEETFRNLQKAYEERGEFDTGICGTDVLLRVLFEHGAGETAVRLLMSEKDHSFGGLMKRDATTLWEYWPESGDLGRSLNHPMFGAAAAYLFDYVLGIRPKEGNAGETDLWIAPVFVPELNRVSGRRHLPAGDLSVSYVRAVDTGVITVKVCVPKGVKAEFAWKDGRRVLHEGENLLTIPG